MMMRPDHAAFLLTMVTVAIGCYALVVAMRVIRALM